jgi:hypothetical protein
MKTTIGDLIIKGQHVGTGTVFLESDSGEKYQKPHMSDKIYQGGAVVGERTFYCVHCKKDAEVSKAFAYSPDVINENLKGVCMDDAKALGYLNEQEQPNDLSTEVEKRVPWDFPTRKRG